MINFPFNKEIEILMVRTYNQFSEKEKRNYAAIEALKLGQGGIKYIAELFGLSPKTVRNGVKELKKMISAKQEESDEKEEDVKR
jgi:hypothetical protein